MYSLLRSALFCLPTETSHDLAMNSLNMSQRLGLQNIFVKPLVNAPVEVMGLTFPNAVGMSAGLDKNGDYFNALGGLGFGFVEIGTITPKAQPGNPQPRLFRLPEHQAIINRMGFNNQGIEYLVNKVNAGGEAFRQDGKLLGINIGKNKTTPNEKSLDDYIICMQQAYLLADYITVNISSPNTPGLRDLQFGETLQALLNGIREEQLALADQYGRYVPIAVKIAPDLEGDALRQIADILVESGLDAVIATNTTIDKHQVANHRYGAEQGGLSGAPLTEASTQLIASLSKYLDGKLPIIGVGGILSAQDALDKINAGASLVQLYTGFIYQGPKLIHDCASAIAANTIVSGDQ